MVDFLKGFNAKAFLNRVPISLDGITTVWRFEKSIPILEFFADNFMNKMRATFEGAFPWPVGK